MEGKGNTRERAMYEQYWRRDAVLYCTCMYSQYVLYIPRRQMWLFPPSNSPRECISKYRSPRGSIADYIRILRIYDRM